MNSSQEEQLLAREFASRVLPKLPNRPVAASVEVNAWAVTVHCYQTLPIEDEPYDKIERESLCLLNALPSRLGEPWQLTVTLHRVQPGVEPVVLGCRVESPT